MRAGATRRFQVCLCQSDHFGVSARRAWIRKVEAGSRLGAAYRLDYRTVGGRAFGVNQLPDRACVDTYDQLWTLLGTHREVAAFSALVDQTRSLSPGLVPWAIANPHAALAVADTWPRIVAASEWIAENRGRGTYLRQIDVPGVDTKLIEANRGVLGKLVALLVDANSVVDPAQPTSSLELRYGFARKPEYVRLRSLGSSRLPGGLTELAARVDELSLLEVAAGRVFIVENEVTYLAFPPAADAVVIFGQGYDLTRLARLGWLGSREVHYWGDLDTHGFVMLSRLRSVVPHVSSFLMDTRTLLAHESLWGSEQTPVNTLLTGLTPEESDLYRALVENTYGHRVRLEQERINYAWLVARLNDVMRSVS
ncbi:MAG: Wadjet anti-phage system protein JetD domain-containing protein [Mycobacteriales bacterium]